MQDPTLHFLRTLVTHGENKYCFDCHQRGPTYVNITIGSFVCTACSGALRKYNHRVKSISMSNFSQSEIDFLCTRGNKACRKIYLALCEDQTISEKDLKDAALDNYLRQKYQLQKWYREPTSQIESEALKENRELLEQAEKNMNQKGHRNGCGNTAAGLIVLPTRSSTNVSQTNLTGGTTQTGNVNGDSVLAQQSATNKLVSSQKQDARSSQSVTTADSFASFPPSTFPPSNLANTTTTKTDLFINFPSIVQTSINSTLVKPFPPNINSTISSVFTNSSTNTIRSFARPSSGDKYAALAELDGLFKNTGIKPTSEILEKDTNDITLRKTNVSSVSASQWSTPFTPQISYSSNSVIGTQGWPGNTSFKDNIHSLNPFTNSTVGVQSPVFNRFSNPFTSYPAMAVPPSINQFSEPLNSTSSESKNPFLPNPQSFNVNPFSNLANSASTSILHSQIPAYSFSPTMHSTHNFPTKMNNPTNGIVGQLGSSGILNSTVGDATRFQMSNFNPF
ncbi:hypothetical protein MN116_006654 [Schistosoma mekongi]|uniref:Arf-GAP domain-containing protein n=1 Tax=Schistosoma mekongi TaxID=38744 RepID=A0AAE1Z8G8_SCHME|nr:hypothetical protein MN116_006654 [Schistosoma mekongi]